MDAQLEYGASQIGLIKRSKSFWMMTTINFVRYGSKHWWNHFVNVEEK